MKLKFDFWFELPNALICLMNNKCSNDEKNKSNNFLALNKSFNIAIKAINTEVKLITDNETLLDSDKSKNISEKLKQINERLLKINSERTKLFISSTQFSISLLKQLCSYLEEECNSFSYKTNEFKKIDKIFNNCNNSHNSNSSNGSIEDYSIKLIKRLKLSITILRYIYNESVKNLEECVKSVGKNDSFKEIDKNENDKEKENSNSVSSNEFYFFFLVKKVVEKLESKLFMISFKILNDNFNSLKEEITFELNDNKQICKNKKSIRFRANSCKKLSSLVNLSKEHNKPDHQSSNNFLSLVPK